MSSRPCLQIDFPGLPIICPAEILILIMLPNNVLICMMWWLPTRCVCRSEKLYVFFPNKQTNQNELSLAREPVTQRDIRRSEDIKRKNVHKKDTLPFHKA